MSLPKGNREIIVIRQGGKEPQYDEDSRQIYTCTWEEVEHLVCVDHAPVSRGAEADTTTTHNLEIYRETEMFYFSLYKQYKDCSLYIRHGDYIVQSLGYGCDPCPENAGYIFWKVVGRKAYNIMNGCWDFKITGERLGGREQDQLLVECEPFLKQLEGIIAHDH